MNIHIVSCRTIEREVRKAMQETGLDCPVSWVESGLHNFPKKLNAALQEILDGIEADCVLLALGSCGNSLAGLKAGNYQMVYPRVDDCISMLLGSVEARRQYERTYFLTKGWLQNEANIWSEFEYTVRKYGNKKALRIMKEMYKHYEILSLIDNGAYDVQEIRDTAEKIAEAFHLNLQVIPGTTSLLEQLLTGPWDERNFVTIPSHSVFTYANAALYFS